MLKFSSGGKVSLSNSNNQHLRVSVRCNDSGGSSRRSTLIGGLLMGVPTITAPLVAYADEPKYNVRYVPVKDLGSFQKSSQRATFQKRAETVLLKYVDASDASMCVHLALLDAGSYDIVTKTGGAAGAIILDPRSAVPSSLKSVIEKLKKAKDEIDNGDVDKAGSISWADLIYLAGKVTTQAGWRAVKAVRAPSIVDQLLNPWDVVLGRQDSDMLGPNKVPLEDATVQEVTAYFAALGAKPGNGSGLGPFSPKPPFWEKPAFLIWTAASRDPSAEEAKLEAYSQVYADIKKQYDRSRDTVSRTDYEVDFAQAYNKLTGLGARISKTAYLHPEAILATKL
ncbi:hypothetical protein CEUSTIGMA_g11810.t1 [Chlamydomonas eustigma]|uniref:Plant heme peroxidase family profile domain-containing protein n=1 Tax=Chlamydomonas eustigma TaxID=1157962 RepID=A0A250XMU4_9CHLO|nr:hypothetical protein CEUSTIGMA_g11810.t1 [Chlamydomonas eustigma]|eukprot:GAX84388.1 hypothetical protein CEUSTIGMA_g11810.t1 [Chlamydomonas eustigma]